MAKKIVIIGTLDTKESEGHYLMKQIRKYGHDCILFDVSLTQYTPKLGKADISNQEVAKASSSTLDKISAMARKPAMEIMIQGASKIAQRLYKNRDLDGIIGYGGGSGLIISSSVLKTLPLEVPKVIITALSADAGKHIGTKNIGIFPSIADLSGGITVNRIESITLAHAAGAISGMVEAEPLYPDDKPIILATQFGVTTPHLQKAKEILEGSNYEVISFPASGVGGQTFEDLVQSWTIAGVLDLTTHELADELVGGVLSAGPKRMEAAGKRGVPQVITPGALDMVNFWAPHTVPEKFKNRHFYYHSPNVTLMRTTPDECWQLGRIVAKKINKAKGPTVLLIPLKGWSTYDIDVGPRTVNYYGKDTSKPWHDIKAIDAFVKAVEKKINKSRTNIEVLQTNLHINDLEFIRMSTTILDDMIKGKRKRHNKKKTSTRALNKK